MVGRIAEIRQLEKLYSSRNSEFVAVYGRRRVGKTYLIKEVFKDRMTFWHTGVSPYDRERKNLMQDQLRAFHYNLQRYGLNNDRAPKDWFEAFHMLSELVESNVGHGKKVIFIDEMPWMDTARARFIPALENFYNDWAAKRDDILLIVCGSATSWIEDKLIHSKGGLYRRLTDTIHLEPFHLSECWEFYQAKGVVMSEYDVAQSYMILGGIPYYMNFVDAEYSLVQNIDRMFFNGNAKLEDEFDLLFGSLFSEPEQYKAIVRLLAKRHGGFTRSEIAEKVGLSDGGGLTEQLKSLEASNFIMRYVPFGERKRTVRYRLCDNFCRFWLNFKEGERNPDQDFWLHNCNSPSLNAWRGFAFEELCMNHIVQIKNALGISGVTTSVSSYVVKGDDSKEGSQVDMIIDRADNVVNLCEMKFYNEEFRISKEYNAKLVHRINMISESLPKRKVVRMTLVTTEGLARNEYSSTFQNIVTLPDLMR